MQQKTATMIIIAVVFTMLTGGLAANVMFTAQNNDTVAGVSYIAYNTFYAEAISSHDITAGCVAAPPPVPIVEISIAKAHKYFLAKKLTCEQLVKEYIKRTESYDKKFGLNSISFILPDVVAVAKKKDGELKKVIDSKGKMKLPALFCVPFVVKDNYDTVGVPTTAGATALLDNYPKQDCTIIKKLKAAGAIVFSKAAMSEFAQSAVHSFGSEFGIVRNPYNVELTTGGSSGGTASAVAANLGLIGLGSDTGSSVRTPSAFQNLVGLRPSQGLVSRAGIVPLDFYRDIGGPMGRSVADVATVFSYMTGYDPKDNFTKYALTNPYPTDYTKYLKPNGLKGKRVGVLYYLAVRPNFDPTILSLFEDAVATMKKAGATIVNNVTIKGNSLGSQNWDPNNGHFQSWPVGFGKNAHFEQLTGQCSLFEEGMNDYLKTAGTKYNSFAEIYYYGKVHPQTIDAFASDLNNPNTSSRWPPKGSGLVCNCLGWDKDPCQGEFRKRVIQALDDHKLDVLVYPVEDGGPPYIGPFTAFSRNTYIAPQTGTPALSIPMGFDPSNNAPVGLMLTGRPFKEQMLIEVGYAFEQLTQWRTPPKDFPECKIKVNKPTLAQFLKNLPAKK